MRSVFRVLAFGGTLLGALALYSEVGSAIETTYGEDPVPNAHCYDGFIDLGYGIDPIPAQTLPQRLQAWRRSRGKATQPSIFERQVETSNRSTTRLPADNRPSSRRAFQSQSASKQR